VEIRATVERPADYGVPVPSVLGISVPKSLPEHWPEWFAPACQPFRTDRLDRPLPVGRQV